MHTKTIFKNIQWLSVYEIVSAITGFLFYIVLARALGERGFGVYTYIFSFLGLVQLFIDLGVSSFFLRKWSTKVDELKNDISLILGTRIFILVITSALLFPYVFFIDRSYSLEFLLAYVFISLELIKHIPVYFLNSQNKFDKSFIINGSERVLTIGIGALLLLGGHTLVSVLIIFILGRILSLSISYLIVPLKYTLLFDIKKTLQLIKMSLPLFFVGFFTTLYFRIDILMVRYLLGFNEVGIYGATYRILEALIIIPGLLSTTSFPTIAQLYKDNKLKDLSLLLDNISKYLSFVSFFIAAFITIYAQDILSFLYGSQYQEGALTLIILGWTSFFLFLSIPYSRYLFAFHQEKYMVKLVVVISLLNILLNSVLIPLIGITGAAISTLLCEVIMLIFSALKIRIFPSYKIFIAPFMLSVGLIFVLYFLNLPMFVGLFVFGTLYTAILLITKQFDIKALWNLRN